MDTYDHTIDIDYPFPNETTETILMNMSGLHPSSSILT